MTKKRAVDGALPFWERMCFSFGDLGYQVVFYWVTAFLMIFYTDVFLIPAGTVSVLMLVVRLYDAINDPIIGSMMDRTRGKLGRYRPWILTGGGGLLVSAVFMFWAHPSWSGSAKTVYMYFTYIVVVTFSTMFYMAYMALNGCISVNAMERSKASSLRMVMSYLGMLLIGYGAPYMLELFGRGSQVEGYLFSVILCCIIAVPLILATGLGTREVVYPEGSRERIPLTQQWKALLQNRPMMILLFCMTAHGFQMNGRLGVATYYCTYVANGPGVLALFNLLNSLLAILGSVTAPGIFRITGHKGKASAVILYLCTASMVLQYFTKAPSITFYLLVSITGFCYGAFSSLMFSMIPDAVDYAQYRHGVRVDGFLNAMASFGFKVGGAVSMALTGMILARSGYVPNVQQSEGCLRAIRILMTALPGFICFLAATFLLFYQLDGKAQKKIIDSLKHREEL